MMVENKANQAREDQLQAIIGQAKARLTTGADEIAEMAGHYFARLGSEDLLAHGAEALFGAALGHWRFAAERPAGGHLVRVFNPRLDSHGWHSPHTVVETVTDDMPFLVDSITAALAREGRGVHLIAHPVLNVARDAAGRRTALAAPGADGAIAESLIHIEIDEDGDAESRAALAAALDRVLGDVRAAVDDWRPMLHRLAEAAESLAAVPGIETEMVDFLRWLLDGNFVLLASRDYRDGAQGEGLGLLRDARVHAMGRQGDGGVHHLRSQDAALVVTKANMESTVHRRAIMDFVGVKLFDANGRPAGERRFYGLFASAAYQLRPRDIPLLRGKGARVLARAGFAPDSHDGKALLNAIETFPRDELFQVTEDELAATTLGILRLEERPRTGLFLRVDGFERWISALVYLPREQFDTALRQSVEGILTRAAGGEVMSRTSLVGQTELARVHLIVRATAEGIARLDPAALEKDIVLAARGWTDRLREALIGAEGEDQGLRLARRWLRAFPSAYRESHAPAAALFDIARGEALLARGPGAVSQAVYRLLEDDGAVLRFKLYRLDQPVPLSDCLPLIEHLGLKVMEEVPHALRLADGRVMWLHDFRLIEPAGRPLALETLAPLIEDAFAQLWAGRTEDDRFNRLVVLAAMPARDVMVLRAIARYLRQIGIPYSQDYMEETLARWPGIARQLVDLFRLRHDPAFAGDRPAALAAQEAAILAALDEVASLDEDRILRRFLNVVDCSLRTNLFQAGGDGGHRACLAIKLDSRRIDGMPLPKPLVEIWVFSPRVEGVHLRGGKVARGGIRWSDRREDFRTEILGLVKAQMVKNAVIVPTGSKGGFYPKRLPGAAAGREAIQAEAIECYKIFIGGLLDLTDNIRAGALVPPADVVRHDGDDPYLVVAADKGTATFSDIANGIAEDRGFWLGDAFASGGSAGYDHKAMGITARGAWEAVKRHFREFGHDTQAQDFTVAGVGDMSGDVFGNGMLLSDRIRLVAAFDHRHIFIDPNPDAAAGFAERQRLFALARSSWDDYDRALISAGGGVFPRSLKAVPLSPEIRALLGLEAAQATPQDLMQAILKAPVDLLWFGGIGTYIKATSETNAQAGDKANDGIRIDARQLRARVVGEGANLGCTQRGRIEYAAAGGSINTDAIDNSAGVDCSDHEVNIKILLNGVMADGDLTRKQRDALLREMTDEVGDLVLRDNYLQTQAISMIRARGRSTVENQIRLMRMLEAEGRLDRGVEYLPGDDEMRARARDGQGLTRPEAAVLLAYAKMRLQEDLLEGDAPEDAFLGAEVARYFPARLQARYGAEIERHRLRREIIATQLANAIVNWTGPTFVSRIEESTGFEAGAVARAFVAARIVFRLDDLAAAIDALDGLVPAATQTAMLLATGDATRQATMWLLHNEVQPLDIAGAVGRFGPGVAGLAEALPDLLPLRSSARFTAAKDRLTADGVPEALAGAIAALPLLAGALDIVAAAGAGDVLAIGGAYFRLGDEIGLEALREAAAAIEPGDHWDRLALTALADDLYAQQRLLAAAAIKAEGGVDGWLAANAQAIRRTHGLLGELGQGGASLAKLTFAGRHLRGQFSV
ncbi:NAD-glutamate dehydrogenase [Zavarzinia compransoris]|uniref:NAD-glutamate dehydrogenase n=1 Tax=Zavarzinia compransoris TaxID=1264899 RepID=A0A317E0Y2_9PROT|nr:NAD-glutamate dehydrogenase [Zavarzinia compransoris]PWR20609.1 NAD-glutamate dehydrogenase [Zavarzinia compransoris]TDP44576.1 glutamate dehydrogenase (NAD) [Zavarzinia compransoris]